MQQGDESITLMLFPVRFILKIKTKYENAAARNKIVIRMIDLN